MLCKFYYLSAYQIFRERAKN